jgi:hypothetical protein
MAGACGSVTMTNIDRSGSGVDSAPRAERPLRSCRIGWRLAQPSACVAGNRPVSGSWSALPSSKQCHTARICLALPIHPRCAVGHSFECSPFTAGRRPEQSAASFCKLPPSLPGISGHSAVFCHSRQEVRDSPSSRRSKAADSTAALSTWARLVSGAATYSRPLDGSVSLT